MDSTVPQEHRTMECSMTVVHLACGEFLELDREPFDGVCISRRPLRCLVHLVNLEQRDLQADSSGSGCLTLCVT